MAHCHFLKEDPGACECLPAGAGEGYAERPCPNNTYAKDGEIWAQWRAAAAIVEAAEDAADRAAMGLLPGPDELTTEEFQLARIMRRRELAEAMTVAGLPAAGKTEDGH